VIEDFREKYKLKFQNEEIKEVQGFQNIYIEMNELLMLNGCVALRDDYYAYDSLPYKNSEKGKLFLVGKIYDLLISL
jgi:hypothetical protein